MYIAVSITKTKIDIDKNELVSAEKKSTQTWRRREREKTKHFKIQCAIFMRILHDIRRGKRILCFVRILLYFVLFQSFFSVSFFFFHPLIINFVLLYAEYNTQHTHIYCNEMSKCCVHFEMVSVCVLVLCEVP